MYMWKLLVLLDLGIEWIVGDVEIEVFVLTYEMSYL